MLRKQSVCVAAATIGMQARHASYASHAATLAPVPGHSGGMLNTKGDLAGAGPKAEEERRRPILRSEVAPTKKEWNAISTMHKWGTRSLALYRRVNEDAGQWYLADSVAIASTFNMIAGDVAASSWGGLRRATFGLAEGNRRPDTLFCKSLGTKDAQGAIHFDYEESAEMRKTEPQLFLIPHSKEHAMHKRMKNPALPKFTEMENIHFRRVLREAQYHLGHSLRFYMVDGVFGNDNATGTPFRVFTDSPNHAYVATISGCRKFNYVSNEETDLVKRTGGSTMEEFAWRRPPVLIYHCPGYDFEAPRIVEEFGGPRPADLGLKHQKFVAIDPYAIPMKAVMAGVLGADELLKTTAFLCSRWGFYADDKKYITLAADAVTSKDGKTLTVVVGESEAVRSSPFLHATRNIRVADGIVSRCWDSQSLPASAPTRARDYVEKSTNTIFRPFTTRVSNEKALSHRLFGRRTQHDFNSEHNYTNDAAAQAAAAGHLLGAKADTEVIRAAQFKLEDTKFIVLGAKGATLAADAAAKAIVSSLASTGYLYAEEDKLVAAITEMLGKAKSVSGEEALAKAVKGE